MNYLIEWVLLGVDKSVRCIVKRSPVPEQLRQALRRVPGKQRPVGSRLSKSGGRRAGLYSKVYGRAGTRHKYPYPFIRDPPGARSNYSRGRRQALGGSQFQCAEGGLAVLRKDADNRLSRRLFDLAVEVNERNGELCRDCFSYG